MRKAVLFLLVIAGAGSAALLTFALQNVGMSRGYAPVQPIAFSHALHAGEHEIPCLYCHFAAERSRHAGIPPSAMCMSCHGELKVQTVEIARLKEAVAQQRPIEWVQVHNLPDFVYFSHAQHVRVAGLDCRECHGPVETMERLRQEAPLTMGWCLDCHRQHGITESDLADLVAPADSSASAAPAAATGGSDCSKCHY